MKIGFDLDKIFVDYPPFIPDSLIDRLYKKKSHGELLYRIPSGPEQLLRKLSHYHRFRGPMTTNLAFLYKLSKKNYELFLISSRFSFLERQTMSLVKSMKIDKLFSEMYFNFANEQPHIFKERILKELKLDIYIDDDLQLLEFVSKTNKRTRYFWLYKGNKGTVPPEITQIKQLSDLDKYI